MILNRDYFDNPIVPDYVLCKANKERIGTLKCTKKTVDIKYNDLNEISFTTYLNIDDEKNLYYEKIDVMKYILLPNIGFFYISDCNVQSEGTEFEFKEVTAKSYEGLMSQKYVENFIINIGTVDSIDGVSFYRIDDKSKSLLHLVLEKCPDWKIGHIDPAITSMQRSFKVDRQDVYSFLMNDVANAFKCIFLFDTLTNTINIYKEKNVGEDTDVHVSYNNLLKNTNISCSVDNIKTCLTITGSDDLNIREINMGYDRIINCEAFNSTEYMSEDLYDSYNTWVELQNEYKPQYTTLLSDYQDYYTQINYLTYEKMPDNLDSTDWTLYGLNPLKEKLAVYEQKQAVSMKAGHGNVESSFYTSEYLPIYNSINAIKAQIDVVNTELNDLKASQDSIKSQMNEIINIVSMDNNFTKKQLEELSTFIREEELNSDNFVVTDIMTDEERFDMLNQMLKYGEEELLKLSTPQLSFSTDMINLFAVPEFEKLYGKFDVGNYIWVSLRDDYHVKAKLLTIHMNFYDITDFSVTFGNIFKKDAEKLYDISNALSVAESVATSVSFNSSYWSQAYQNANNITQMLADGLLSQGAYLTDNPDNSDLLIDSRGIFVNTTSGEYANKDSIFIGGGRILFTDDAWKTVAMAVGRADVNGESRFGVFADFCIAAYIAGSIIEGNEIIGGTITGSTFNNGNGTFSVDANGKVIASDMNITKGMIGGCVIENNSIHSSNGSWYINSDGTSSLTKPYIAGVQNGSSFGSIGYNGTNTYGTFTGNSYFGSAVSNPFSGTCVTHIETLSANYIKTNYLDAMNANISGKANIGDLNAINAQVTNLSATKLDASEFTATNISAMNITVKSANITGKLSVSQINGEGVGWTTHKVVTDVRISQQDKDSNGCVTNVELAYDWTNLYYLGGR